MIIEEKKEHNFNVHLHTEEAFKKIEAVQYAAEEMANAISKLNETTLKIEIELEVVPIKKRWWQLWL